MKKTPQTRKDTAQRRLQLKRQIVRELTPEELARVSGGDTTADWQAYETGTV